MTPSLDCSELLGTEVSWLRRESSRAKKPSSCSRQQPLRTVEPILDKSINGHSYFDFELELLEVGGELLELVRIFPALRKLLT